MSTHHRDACVKLCTGILATSQHIRAYLNEAEAGYGAATPSEELTGGEKEKYVRDMTTFEPRRIQLLKRLNDVYDMCMRANKSDEARECETMFHEWSVQRPAELQARVDAGDWGDTMDYLFDETHMSSHETKLLTMRRNLLMVRARDVDVAVTAVKMTHEQLDALETLIDEKARERHFDATQSMLQMTVGTVVSVYAHIHVVLSLAVFFDQTWVFSALRQIATCFEDDRWITAGLQLIGLPYWGGAPPVVDGPTEGSSGNGAAATPLNLPTVSDMLTPSWFTSFNPFADDSRWELHRLRVAAHDRLLHNKVVTDASGSSDYQITSWLNHDELASMLRAGDVSTWLAQHKPGYAKQDVLRVLGIVRWVGTSDDAEMDTEWTLWIQSLGDLCLRSMAPYFSFVDTLLLKPITWVAGFLQQMPGIPQAADLFQSMGFGLTLYSLLPHVLKTFLRLSVAPIPVAGPVAAVGLSVFDMIPTPQSIVFRGASYVIHYTLYVLHLLLWKCASVFQRKYEIGESTK